MKCAEMSNCSKKCKVITGFAVAVGISAAVYLIVRTEEAFAKPPLGKQWPAAQQVSIDAIDHSAFDMLLKKYVDSDGYVKYQAWKDSTSDRGVLQNYLVQLGRASLQKRSSRSAQLAFWINAYNAVTLEGILQVYPTSSIRNHTARLAGYNIWKDLPLQVGSQAISLNDMEHKVLRKMNEPRIHFSIVCASISCPRLRNEAYTAKNLEQQLADNTTDFFARSQNFHVDTGNQTIYVSSIVDWFSEDFGGSQTERFRYLQRYLPRAAQQLATNSGTRVKYIKYNWDLNDQPRKPRTASSR